MFLLSLMICVIHISLTSAGVMNEVFIIKDCMKLMKNQETAKRAIVNES